MIKHTSFQEHWLEKKMQEHQTRNFELAEKMAHAFCLLERLKTNGLAFIFKGGTSLVLMMDSFHRFSKDIDIIVHQKPAALSKIFDAVASEAPFLRWEPSIRQNDEFTVPKEHYKFYYKAARNRKFAEQPILLDIIFVPNPYPELVDAEIAHFFLETEEPVVKVSIPSIDSITGDKLTAFAPGTIGIPAGKGKALEIAKQLYDLDLLYERIGSPVMVAKSFEQTANMCVKHYQKPFTAQQVYDDIIYTSKVMAMKGELDRALFDEIKKGVGALGEYISSKRGFTYEAAVLASARIAYLAACLSKGTAPKEVAYLPSMLGEIKQRSISHPDYAPLNKALKKTNLPAWLYWEQIAELLAVPPRLVLYFIVNGREVEIEVKEQGLPLLHAVQEALNKSGNSGRPASNWLVKWKDADLNTSLKIAAFHFPEDAKIFLSLKSGEGGSR